MKMKKLILILAMLFAMNCYSQTMIEMAYPEHANIVLQVVKDTADADVIIYISDEKRDYESWDCMWKVKSWGFSNFSFYLVRDLNDSLLTTPEGVRIPIAGKVYFTDNKKLRGYKSNKLYLDGVMKVKRIPQKLKQKKE